MEWETVAQIVAIIAAVSAAAISPLMIVIFSNLMTKRIDDVRDDIKELRSIMSTEHAKLYSAVTSLAHTVHEIDRRLSVLESKQNTP